MALVHVIDIASGQVVAAYPVPPTQVVQVQPGQEVFFVDIPYGDPTAPNVIVEVIGDSDVQVTTEDGTVLIEGMFDLLENGDQVRMVFSDTGQSYGEGQQAVTVPEFASLDAFAPAAAGPGDGGDVPTGTGGRGNDGFINPPDLNLFHIRAVGIDGEIPRPAFGREDEPETDNLQDLDSPLVLTPSMNMVWEKGLNGTGGGGDGEGDGEGGGGNVLCDPTNGSALLVTINVNEGDVISFDWFFDADDYQPFNDYAFFTVNGEPQLLTNIAQVGSFNATGWATINIVATSTGPLELGFAVGNTGDGGVNSYLLVDNIEVNGVLIPDGSFEAGFGGMSTLGAVTTVSNHDEGGGTPTDGSEMARLTSSSAASANDIETFLSMTTPIELIPCDHVLDDPGTMPLTDLEFAFGTLDTGGGVITAISHPDGSTQDNGDFFVIQGTFPGGEGIDWILTVNKSTGDYEFELLDNTLQHDGINLIGEDDQIFLVFNYSVQVGGQSASSTLTMGVKDDGPLISLKDGENGQNMLFEDGLVNVQKQEAFFPTASQGINFNFGADGPNDTGMGFTIELKSVSDGDGEGGALPDGLKTSETDLPVNTFYDEASKTLIGYTGDNPFNESAWVFTVELTDFMDGPPGPGMADAVFTLYQAIEHPDINEIGADDPIDLLFTITATDGDLDTASVDVLFIVKDDGPNVIVDTGAPLDMLVLDETRPEGTETDGDFDPAGLMSTTADFSDNFVNAPDFGADGPGSASFTLLLNGVNVGSGLYALDPSDTDDGDGDGIGQGGEIVLNQSGNTITGSFGGTDYFTISINPDTGVVTFTQLNNIWHADTGDDDDSQALTTLTPDLLQLIHSVTDSDGDSASASLDLGGGNVFKIEDDGPNASVIDGEAGIPDMLVLDETRPEGTETDGDSNPAGLMSTSANFADNFVAPVDFGTDGPGSVVYSLMLSGPNIGSGLYALDPSDTSDAVDGIGQGDEILLNQVGDVITGSANGTDYFTIEIDPGTGIVTFTQLNNIWHEETDDDDDSEALTTEVPSDLKVVQTVTDADGDSDSAAINLGGGNVFKIEDDGPDASVKDGEGGQPAMLVLDETRPEGTETDGDSNPAGLMSTTANFAVNFVAPADFGTDGPGSIVYSLMLSGPNVGSGLYALDPTDISDAVDGIGQGGEIVMNQAGDVITGSFDGTDYFTIEIDPGTGVVTFTQLNNIWHGDTGNDDDSEALTTEVPSDLKVVQTVTDADGDSDSAAINLGGGNVFKIEDDGPNAEVDVKAELDMLVVDESPLPAAGDGIASAVANFADNFAGPADFGTDGPGSVAYSLMLTGANVGSGLYALDPADTQDVGGDGDGIGQGGEIVLNQAGDVITGSFGGTDYFTIEIDPGTGVVTFTQLENIWHSDTGDHDDSEALTTATPDLLKVVQTVTDADGDSDSASINLGGGNVFKIEDDGPDASVKDGEGGQPAMLVLDESPPPADGDGITSTTANFSLNFVAPVDYGTDGPGSVAYSLMLTGVNVGSGLYALDPADTQDVGGDGDGIGQGGEIVMNQVGNVITGSFGGTDYFTIEIDPGTGIVTFTQLENIWHSDTGDHDDSEALTTLTPDLLKVVQTVTDADGDSDSASINLGGGNVFKIEDDGPDASVKDGEGGQPAMLVLDESPLPADGDGIASTTANFSLNFVAPVDYGTDGPGSVAYSLMLTGANVGSGLYALDPADTQDVGGDGDGIGQGGEIVMNQVGNVITGSFGGTDYFTIEIDPGTGIVTFTQLENIWHSDTGDHDDSEALTTEKPNLLKVVQTVTDADGDSDSASIDLGGGNVFKIEDDGPNAEVDGQAELDMLVVDESPLPADGDGIASAMANFADNFVAPIDYGTDEAGNVAYSLMLTGINVGSGLYALDPADTQDVGDDGDGIGQGGEIVMNQVGNLITGSFGGTDYFTIAIDPGTGIVTFTQLNNIWHGDTGDHDDSEALTTLTPDLLKVVQTVTDADGDSDSASINLGGGNVFKIEDDGPDAAVNLQAELDMLVVDESPLPGLGDGIASAMANFADNFAAPIDYGTDEAGSVVYSLMLTGANVGSGLYALDPADTLDVGDDGDGIGQGGQIVLNQAGDVITGSFGGTNYFTIAIDPGTGIVTFTQLENIWHGDTGDDDDSEALTTLTPDLLKVVQTVIDADGDSDSASINLGGGNVFKIEDDGPDASVKDGEAGEPGMLVLDESPLPAAGDGIASTTENFSLNFITGPVDYGTDGAGSVAYSLNLSANGVGSGLYALEPGDTDNGGDGDGFGQGDEILLSQAGNIITGSVGGTNYFTIEIDPGTGIVTFTQLENIWHGNPNNPDDSEALTTMDPSNLQVVQTVTDADGDSDSAAIDLGGGNVFKIEDDGPAIEILPAVVDGTPTTDETEEGGAALNGTWTSDESTDGTASIEVLVDADGNGAPESYGLDTDIPVQNDGGDALGTLRVNSDGSWVFTPADNINHGDAFNDFFDFTLKITDVDGDTDEDTHTISVIDDDEPTAENATLTHDETPGVDGPDDNASTPAATQTALLGAGFLLGTINGAIGSATESLTYSGNGDGISNIAFDVTHMGSTGLFTGGNAAPVEIFYYVVSDTLVLGTTNAAGTQQDAVDNAVFALHIDADLVAETGDASVIQFGPINHNDSADPDEAVSPETLAVTYTVTAPDADDASATITVNLEDDGPDASALVLGFGDVTHDETPGVQAAAGADDQVAALPGVFDGTGVIGWATASITVNDGAAGVYGTDGPGSVSLSGLVTSTGGTFTNAGVGTSTNLVMTTSGLTVFLFEGAGGVIQGWTTTGNSGNVGDQVDLVIELYVDDATDALQMAQYEAVVHPDAMDPNDDISLLASDGTTALVHIEAKVTDADGDMDATLLALGAGDIVVLDDGPTLVSQATSTGLVEEEELPGGIEDTVPGADQDTLGNFTNTTLTDSGSVSSLVDFGSDGPGGFAFISDTSSLTAQGLTSDGDPLVYNVNGAGTQITATADGNPIFTLNIDAAGNWDFTLQGVLDHPVADQEDLIDIDFSGMVAASDGDGDSITLGADTFVVSVIDDVPMAYNNEDVAEAGEAGTTNYVIVFDRSGSMNDDPNVDGFSERIELAKAAVASLLEAAASDGTINVLIVDFASDADTSGWLTGSDVLEQANAYLNGLLPSGLTDYVDATNLVQTEFVNGTPASDDNVLYFLSDGEPTTRPGGDIGGPGDPQGLSAGEVAAWEAFLANNGFSTAYAIGVGTGTDTNELEEIAYPNTDVEAPFGTEDAVIEVTDESLLIETILSTLDVTAAGNVLTDPSPAPDNLVDSFGADGMGQIVSITVDTGPGTGPGGITTFTYDPAANGGSGGITNNGGFLAIVGATLVVTTDLGGEFTFDFDTGAYEYDATIDTSGGLETFDYTIADNDGDTSQATLSITVPDNPELEGLPLIAGDNGNNDLDGMAGDIAEILAGDDGNDDLFGDGGNDLLLGGDGADTLNGGDGNDFIFGGDGDDDVMSSLGSDTINVGPNGGSHEDTVFYTDILHAGDVIQNFDGSGSSFDVIDLDALFDKLEVDLGLGVGGLDETARFARVQVMDNGDTEEVYINADNNADFEVLLVTVEMSTGNLDEGTEIIVI